MTETSCSACSQAKRAPSASLPSPNGGHRDARADPRRRRRRARLCRHHRQECHTPARRRQSDPLGQPGAPRRLMASSAQAAKAVVVGGLTMGGITLAQSVRAPQTFVTGGVYKRLWGIAVVTLVLGVAADFAAELVFPLAVLIVLAFVVKNQGAFGAIVQGAGQPSTGQGGTFTTPRAPAPSS